MIKVGIVGGTGYVGRDLIKLLLKHPESEIKVLASTSQAGQSLKTQHPDLASDLVFTPLSVDTLNKMDVVFLSVPHGQALLLAQNLSGRIIDMSVDHRLTHTYGLPELFKPQIKEARIIGNPGCYATSCILAAYPIIDLIEHVVFDCISGWSGGGKDAKLKYDYEDNIIAYKLTDHFHKPEIQMVLGPLFSFTPHVVNAFSGIMCTAHVTMKSEIFDLAAVLERYTHLYQNSFTKVVDTIPCTKDVAGTPYCHIGGFSLDGSKRLVLIAVIDNLLKGAASQAIENMNIMFGLDQRMGLN
ncbi:MAG: N-acetyl-gamma-glutamyl-phosphate reductase [Desulfobacteraceae bacterium]|nr:MAG: N-acetyl-gamma-glutamyl-phosphate reductase [Desulfobacteraceae bacterium]